MPLKKILLIDDNPINLRIAKLTMELGGFSVCTAPDAGGALRMLDSWIPDAIVVDLKMPGMDGLSFMQVLQANSEKSCIPVIAMSAYDPPSRARLEQLGFRGFIGKPMVPSVFCQQLQRIFEKPAANVAPLRARAFPSLVTSH